MKKHTPISSLVAAGPNAEIETTLHFDRFYCIDREQAVRSAVSVVLRNENVYKMASELASGAWAADEPIEVDRASGRKLYDFAFDEGAFLCYVSDRVVDALTTNKFAGWRTFPVALHVKGNVQSGYHGLAITGRCGPLLTIRNPRTVYTDEATGQSYEAWLCYYF